MAQQVHVDESAIAHGTEGDGPANLHEVASDLAYARLIMVNVIFLGRHGARDREWVLIDAGLFGTKSMIKDAAAARFGAGSRPGAIVLTHGHFDHVGVLEDLAAEWDVPVWAHELERPYLDGSAAYPPGDPSVGGGPVAAQSPIRGPPSTSPTVCASSRRTAASRPCRAGAGCTRLAIVPATSRCGARATGS
jgi:glyoxylase-like metal-dependent hydrolase (beta-lactamase superfamily II)